MATLHILSNADGPLTNVSVPLPRHEFQCRWCYGGPEVIAWMRNELPGWRQGRLGVADTPKEQFFAWMFRWLSGKEMRYGKMFSDLSPRNAEVWEAKTADVRVFGWLYAPRTFIAVHAGYADHYKYHNRKRICSYDDARDKVVNFRDKLDLDHPKCATGTFDALVRV